MRLLSLNLSTHEYEADTQVMQLYFTSNGPLPELAGQEEPFPEPDNQSKMKRSCENAEHVGQSLFVFASPRSDSRQASSHPMRVSTSVTSKGADARNTTVAQDLPLLRSTISTLQSIVRAVRIEDGLAEAIGVRRVSRLEMALRPVSYCWIAICYMWCR